MNQSELQRRIAEAGYNVGFGAKKHFATYDIVSKVPGWIGWISLSVGIFGLIFKKLSSEIPSAILAIAGISGILIANYDVEKYADVGSRLTKLYGKLRTLYAEVMAGNANSQSSVLEIEAIEEELNNIAINRQIAFSDWYAHFKFFGQHQSKWIVDELNLTFWADKMPNGLKIFTISILILAGASAGVYHFS